MPSPQQSETPQPNADDSALSESEEESLIDETSEETVRQAATPAKPGTIAYLVVREGTTWRDVFRLTPGQVSTIGRAPTNRIVIRDEVCSRNHCEIFQSGTKWTLRDLGSRNGTIINGVRIVSDYELRENELIQIGSYDLGFTYDLTGPLPQFEEARGVDDDTATSIDVVFDHPPQESEPAIIHRARRSRYRSGAADAERRDRTNRELAKLYRLALEMGSAADKKELSDVVLSGLFSGTKADIGAVLLFPKDCGEDPQPSRLQLITYQSKGDLPYQKIADLLSRVVLENREAVLARDVSDDSRLAGRDSLGEILAKSVICAPVQVSETIHGLIHLYSTNPQQPVDPDDLEFTLAVADQFAIALENLKVKEALAVGLARAQGENKTLRRQLEIESELLGDSSVMQQLRETIARIAPTDAITLIRGESGVGKELVARAIHFSSHRRDAPFVCLNCAALSESLLESELFGHEKGSFTGATERKIGKFEQADTGTVFLDEVGEMSQTVQAKFLRVLEGHPFERVGGRKPIEVNVRVVAATNRDLESGVEDGTFRKDLYFRLHVVEIRIAPLREHRSDIALLANHFLERFARKTNRTVLRFAADALDLLMTYDWPGNVRELQNAVERAVILCLGDSITGDDIQLSPLGTSRQSAAESSGPAGYRKLSLDVLEQEHILATLDRTNWNKSQAAQILGIERSTLDRKLKRYRVSRPKGL
ncbi:MAG: sigma 54-interacting transcriptional regulator [Planctomycetes bacterium]|nr:sigma 54-interacting transcriptional regulator [Planctomycetota bacterium]